MSFKSDFIGFVVNGSVVVKFIVIKSVVVGSIVIGSVVVGFVILIVDAYQVNNIAGGTAIAMVTSRMAKMANPISFQNARKIIWKEKIEQKFCNFHKLKLY